MMRHVYFVALIVLGIMLGTATAQVTAPQVERIVQALQSFAGLTGSAPPTRTSYIGTNQSGATGGLLQGIRGCDSYAQYDASDNGSITLVTGVSGRKVYICGYLLRTGAVATDLALKGGTNANCAAGTYAITPVNRMLANDQTGTVSEFWNGMVTSATGDFVCINASAGNVHTAQIWYTIQ